jgi:glycosyltransferase involved in cell wall biosynthesis
VKKLVLGVTVPGSSRLLDGQVRYFKSKGYIVYLLSPDHPKEHKFCSKEGCIHLPVSIEKEISLLSDFKTVSQIIKHLRNVKPDIVNVGTPKMGLLGMIAALILRIPNRIYTCRGLRYESETGLTRTILKNVEFLTVTLASKVIYVGHSVRQTSINNSTAIPKKSFVIGQGSSNGVNLDYFNKSSVDPKSRGDLIATNKLEGKFVIGYLGRISAHKGTYELVEAFEQLYGNDKEIRLMLIGHLDCTKEFEQKIKSHPGILYFEFQDNVPLYMSLFNIFVLPSWREGFSNASIQAAAMGLPVITSNATGCIDAIKPGFNGLIFQKKSVEELRECIQTYKHNDKLVKEHSENSIEWSRQFRPEIIWDGIEEVYEAFLN